MGSYVSTNGLKNVSKYKAGATVDNSLIYNHIVSPWCNSLVEYLPKWIAPNLLTLLGFLCQVGSFVLTAAFIGMDEAIARENEVKHKWVYLASSVLVFLYMMLDNLDGKQARRTKTSSPLGELIDHGSDSMTVAMGGMTMAMTIGLNPWQFLLVFATTSIPFYLAHWEEYFTHSLTLGSFNGPTEAEVMGSALFLTSFVLGRSFWRVTEHVQFAGYSFAFHRNEVVLYALTAVAIFTTVQSLISGGTKAVRMGVGRQAVIQLIPFAAGYLSAVIWIYNSPRLYEDHTVMFVTSYGFVFSSLVSRCIVQRICSEPFRLFYKILIPIFFAAGHSVFAHYYPQHALDEYLVLVVVFAISMLQWFHLVIVVISELCGQLKIKPLTIPTTPSSSRKSK